MTGAMAPEPCTTTAALSRHLSVSLKPYIGANIRGRVGWTLCGHNAYDEAAIKGNKGRAVDLSALKPCGSCARSAAKIEREQVQP